MNEPDNKEKSSFQITVYEDRFVILYFLTLLLYLLIGFTIYVLPRLSPNAVATPRISLLIVPVLCLVVVTVAVIGIAMRASWAPRFYRKTSKTFIVILILASIVTFIRHGLMVSIFITIFVLVLFAPLIFVLVYGNRYLRRKDVRDSFENASHEYRVYDP